MLPSGDPGYPERAVLLTNADETSIVKVLPSRLLQDREDLTSCIFLGLSYMDRVFLAHQSSNQPMSESKENKTYPCPVCGYMSFSEPPGSYDICSVCNWEDDQLQAKHPRMRGGANGGSIFDYQQEEQMAKWVIEKNEDGHDVLERDPDWRPMRPDEAQLPDDEVGDTDYKLDYYHGEEPYYWRL